MALDYVSDREKSKRFANKQASDHQSDDDRFITRWCNLCDEDARQTNRRIVTTPLDFGSLRLVINKKTLLATEMMKMRVHYFLLRAREIWNEREMRSSREVKINLKALANRIGDSGPGITGMGVRKIMLFALSYEDGDVPNVEDEGHHKEVFQVCVTTFRGFGMLLYNMIACVVKSPIALHMIYMDYEEEEEEEDPRPGKKKRRKSKVKK